MWLAEVVKRPQLTQVTHRRLVAWGHVSQAGLSPKSGQKELQAAKGQPVPAKCWDHIVPLLPLPELVHVCLEDSLICNTDAVKYLCILLIAYTTSLPLAYAMGRYPQTYHYKRPHGGMRMSVMAQLSRNRGRSLPKCACRGWEMPCHSCLGWRTSARSFGASQSRAGGWRGLGTL